MPIAQGIDYSNQWEGVGEGLGNMIGALAPNPMRDAKAMQIATAIKTAQMQQEHMRQQMELERQKFEFEKQRQPFEMQQLQSEADKAAAAGRFETGKANAARNLSYEGNLLRFAQPTGVPTGPVDPNSIVPGTADAENPQGRTHAQEMQRLAEGQQQLLRRYEGAVLAGAPYGLSGQADDAAKGVQSLRALYGTVGSPGMPAPVGMTPPPPGVDPKRWVEKQTDDAAKAAIDEAQFQRRIDDARRMGGGRPAIGMLPGSDKPTEAQTRARNYLGRMLEAEGGIERPGEDMEKYSTGFRGAMNRGNYYIGKALGIGPLGVDPTYAKQRTAEDAFIEAKLRPDSGAAIGMGEYASSREQLMPMPADTPDMLMEKRNRRMGLVQGLLSQAGPEFQKAFMQVYGDTLQRFLAGDPAALQELRQAATTGGQPQAQAAPQSGPPPAAIEHLRSDPSLAAAFDEKYGAGAAARVLGGS